MEPTIAVPFNVPFATGQEAAYMADAVAGGHLSGNGAFASRCSDWLTREFRSERAFLTPSCTAALEMAALLLELGPGDEVIMPSFTFVSTANAFVLRGAVPVFVDVDPTTFNIDPEAVRAAITNRTRAVVPVHYAGVGCEMDALLAIASARDLAVVEDAAQGILASEHGHPLGSRGVLATLSFHETKNVMCGEGGALLVNDASFVERAEIIQEKGTDRRRYFRGQVDKYTWVDIGSSYLLSELSAAFLWAQLEHARKITDRRLAVWNRYHEAFAAYEEDGLLRRPHVPADRRHNAHMYYVLLPDGADRDAFIRDLAARGVHAVFHYVPLHLSEAGIAHGRAAEPLPVTEAVSERLVRLPLWAGMSEEHVECVVGAVKDVLAPAPVARR